MHCSLLSFLTSCLHVPCFSLHKFISMSYKLQPHCFMTTPPHFGPSCLHSRFVSYLNSVRQTVDIGSCLLSPCCNAAIICACPYIVLYLQHPLLYIRHDHLYADNLSYYHTSIIVICKSMGII